MMHWEIYRDHISERKLREELLPSLENSCLIYLEPDPNDKRKKLVYPNIPTKKATIDQNNTEEGKGLQLEKEVIKA